MSYPGISGFSEFWKTHKAVASSTVSRWLKEGFSIAGIDTRVFEGHSIHTAADVTRVSICDIMKQG